MRALVAISLSIVVAIAAAPASASLKIHESKRTEQMSTPFDSVTSTCGKREGAISGGYTVPSFFEGDNIFLPYGSFIGEGRGWQASARLAGGNLEGQTITTFAYCSKLGKKVVTRSESADISDGATTDVTASCKSSELLVSGGWAISSSDSLGAVITSLKQGKRSWNVRGGALTEDGSGSVIAIANCVPAGKAPDLVTRRTTTPVAELATADASCKKGEQVISAGFTSDEALFLPFVFHRDTKRSWTTRGAVFGNPGKATIAVYCEKTG